MTEDRELERHNKYVEKIYEASSIDDLPNISFSTIATYLSTNAYFNKTKLSPVAFRPVIDELINYGYFLHPSVKDKFISVIKDNYSNVTDEEINNLYNKIASSKRIGYLIQEIGLRNEKIDRINKREAMERHASVIKSINEANDIKSLPKVGKSELNRELLKCVNDNDFKQTFRASDIKTLTASYLNKDPFDIVKVVVDNICSLESDFESDKELMSEQILGSLILNDNIEFIVDEILLKEKRKLIIYKNEHEQIMNQIKEATRISELPSNVSFSSLTNYLNGNTTIYSNDDRIVCEDLKILTELLLANHKWEEEIVRNEISDICTKRYPEKDDAFKLLYDKLSDLPRTYYLVEEINESNRRQEEFTKRRCSNVNVYFIPNDKSPIDGGRFYDLYINRVDNLNLNSILPLDLDTISTLGQDNDSIEKFIQENYDKTFKRAGGAILNRDETIGNVSVFRPNDGTIGVSPEEKANMDKIEDLNKEIEEKTAVSLNLDIEIEEKQKKLAEADVLFDEFKKDAFSLYKNFLENLGSLENKKTEEEKNSDDEKGLLL